MFQDLPNSRDSARAFSILYDGMIYERQTVGGINRYFENLISNLPDHVNPSITLTQLRSTNFPQNASLQRFHRRFVLPKPFRGVGRKIQAVRFRMIEEQIKPDLIHATYYDTLSRRKDTNGGPPLVLTVHDMTHEKLSRLLDRRRKHAIMKKRSIEMADAIICVSHRTREDLLEVYPECESKTTVIHHATELGSVVPAPWRSEPDRPYFLYVGSRTTYKNFDRLLVSFRSVARTTSDVQLRAVGAPFSKKEWERIDDLGLQDHVIEEGHVDDARLASLYRKSVGLAYPSSYEGFGLPLLEAMSCDTPVLAANCSCIPEVVQDAALLFDPTSNEQLTEGLNIMLHDSQRRASLIEKGRIRCKVFSWAKSAEQTVSVYNAVLARSCSRRKPGAFNAFRATRNEFKPKLAWRFPLF